MKLEFFYFKIETSRRVGRVDMLPSDTIRKFKERVFEKTGIYKENQEVWIRGKVVVNEDLRFIDYYKDIVKLLFFHNPIDVKIYERVKIEEEEILIIREDGPTTKVKVPSLETKFIQFRKLVGDYEENSLLLEGTAISGYYHLFTLKKLFDLFDGDAFFMISNKILKKLTLNVYYNEELRKIEFFKTDSLYTFKMRIEEMFNINLGFDFLVVHGKKCFLDLDKDAHKRNLQIIMRKNPSKNFYIVKTEC